MFYYTMIFQKKITHLEINSPSTILRFTNLPNLRRKRRAALPTLWVKGERRMLASRNGGVMRRRGDGYKHLHLKAQRTTKQESSPLDSKSKFHITI